MSTSIPTEKGSVVWARLVGFCWWPARMCSQAESDTIAGHMPNMTQKHLAVTFLGSSLQRGWVNENSIKPFDAESLNSKLTKKKLKFDRTYLEAVIEAIRIAMAAGVNFEDSFLAEIEAYQDIDWNRTTDVCRNCRGTEWSGDSLLCDRCGLGEVHLHCLANPIMLPPDGDWFCPDCCKELGLPEDYMPPISDDLVVPVEASCDDSSPTLPDTQGGVATQPPQGNGGMPEGQPARKRVATSVPNGGAGRKKACSGGSATASGSTTGNLLDAALLRVLGDRNKPPAARPDRPRGPTEKLPPLDYCMVCRLESSESGSCLVVCDFPACRRAYHPVCIPARLTPPFPPPVDSTDVWFCPSHYCTGCSSLESAREKIAAFPVDVIATGAHLPGGVDLQHCSTCPFSICLSCAAGLGGGRARGGPGSAGGSGVFRNVHVNTLIANEVKLPQAAATMSLALKSGSKKLANTFEENKVTCCLNCTSSNARLSLARFLEELYANMASNKLAEPFLYPLLPGVLADPEITGPRSVDPCPAALSGTKDTVAAGPSVNSAKPLQGLFSVLLRIRSLFYDSYDSFAADVKALRDDVERILKDYYGSRKEGQSDGRDFFEPVAWQDGGFSQHCLIQSFDSMSFAACHLTRGKQFRLRGITDRLLAPPLHRSASAAMEDRMLSMWRQECTISLSQYFQQTPAMDTTAGNVVSPRSLSAWCRYMDSAMVMAPSIVDMTVSAVATGEDEQDSGNLTNPFSVARGTVDRLLEMAAADALADIRDMCAQEAVHAKEPDKLHSDANVAVNGFPLGSSERASDTITDWSRTGSAMYGTFGDSLEVLEHLHQVTSTALKLQSQLKMELVARHAAVREFREKDLPLSDTLHIKPNSPLEDPNSTVTLGDLHIIRELKMLNDNLNWKLRRQSTALQRSAETIYKLTQQNALLTNRLHQLTGGEAARTGHT